MLHKFYNKYIRYNKQNRLHCGKKKKNVIAGKLDNFWKALSEQFLSFQIDSIFFYLHNKYLTASSRVKKKKKCRSYTVYVNMINK